MSMARRRTPCPARHRRGAITRSETLDGNVREDQRDREEDRPQRRDDDASVSVSADAPSTCAALMIAVDTAQPARNNAIANPALTTRRR